MIEVKSLPSTSKSPHPTARRSLASSWVFSYATASILRYWSLKSNTMKSKLIMNSYCYWIKWRKEVQVIQLTNRSPPSSIGGKFTREGFTNSLSRSAVTRCSRTRYTQNRICYKFEIIGHIHSVSELH